MKKIISLLLSVIMVFSLVAVPVAAEDDNLVITVANDLHLTLTLPKYDPTEDFAHVEGSGRLSLESVAILEKFFKEAAANESDLLILPGDLIDRGTPENFTAMKLMLEKFEKESGKPVYVVPGNHAFQFDNATIEDFVSCFYEFGYSESIARDPLSGSYVAELNDEYRLLAIDSTAPKTGGHGLTQERVDWIEQQAALAQEQGKKMISMMHHNLLSHFVLSEQLIGSGVVASDFNLPEIFAKYDVKYNFCGHTHDHDIISYTGENGNTIYDVVTGTINAYPCPYRVVTFGEKVKIETRHITSIDNTAAFEGLMSDYCFELLNTDFTEYAKQCWESELKNLMSHYVDSAVLKRLLKLDPTEDAEMCALFDKLIPELKELINLPLYAKNETEEGKSIESLAAKIDMSVKETGRESFLDLAAFLYISYATGDESFGILSPEYHTATTSLTVIFYELLKDVSGEEYTMVLDFICRLLGLEEYLGIFTKYTGDGIAKLEGINFFVSGVLSALILQFTTDPAPADNNVTLPGYIDNTAEPEAPEDLTFWEKIVKFFKDIFSYLVRILGF